MRSLRCERNLSLPRSGSALNPFLSPIRKPIIRHKASLYLLYTLLSFAGSVSFTRLFLFLTGYPKIGGGSLHIAHVLWGGLFLFIAGLLPLVYANRWAMTAGAILAGVGVGLFIDEVGKFITMNNDYFHPSAAPIIYVFFLFTVLIYLRVRRQRSYNVRAELYEVFDDLQEVIDQDLSQEEQYNLVLKLENIVRSAKKPDLARLAVDLKNFVTHKDLYLSLSPPNFFSRLHQVWNRFEHYCLTRTRFRAILIGGMAAVGVWMVSFPTRAIFFPNSANLQEVLLDLANRQLVHGFGGVRFFEIHVGMEFAIGFFLILSSLGLLFGLEIQAIQMGSAALLIALTLVNLFVFYFDQFSSITNAVVQFILLIGAVQYRVEYLSPLKEIPT